MRKQKKVGVAGLCTADGMIRTVGGDGGLEMEGAPVPGPVDQGKGPWDL